MTMEGQASATHNGKPRSPLFVVGFARSGTTLLRALLGAHPDIQMASETEFQRALRAAGFSLTSRLQPADRGKLIATINGLSVAKEYLTSLPPDRKGWLGSTSDEEISARLVYESLLGVSHSVPVWGEKSLGNLFHIDEILDVYPNALIVHIVRDPRASLLSLYRKRFFASDEVTPTFDHSAIRFFAYRSYEWVAWMNVFASMQRRAAQEAIFEVKYEALVCHPEDVLSSICRHLCVPFSQEMLNEGRRQNEPTLSRSGAFAHRRLAEPIDPTRAAAFQDLPPFARYIVELITARYLQHYEYPATAPRLSIATKARVWTELLCRRWRMKRQIAENARRRLNRPAASPKST